VPAQLLFEINNIDLNGQSVSYDEVGRLNPQCGDMRHLHHVVWMSDDNSQALGVKYVREDEFWVPGHIPGRPLLPGVLMIEAGAQLSSITYLKKSGRDVFLGFTRCDDVVFRDQVVPGDDLYILAKEKDFGARRFISHVQGIVKDRLVFEAQITGMVM
jgi:3-hydroxyacyl-[acyl-carrier-protein] dehydratase